MLLNLNIIDLAVVKQLNLDFTKGMSVLTGETGAGKSILLTALGLALGERANADYVRPDCALAQVCLRFDLKDAPTAHTWLQQQQLGDSGFCTIRRVVKRNGRSQAYINDKPVSLPTLQALSGQLVEIHGQHAHLTLLDNDEQRRLLDVYAKNTELLNAVNHCYNQWHQANKELTQLLKTAQESTQREELLRYQLDELAQLNLGQLNYHQLIEQHTKSANLEQILSVGNQQLALLYGDKQSITRGLSISLKELTALSQFAPELNEVCSLLLEAQIQADEAAQSLRRFLDNQEIDAEQLEFLESQLSAIQNASRKYHVKPEDLAALELKLVDELDAISNSSERIEHLQKLTEQLLAQYKQLAAQLSKKRQTAAEQLQLQISKVIKELGMPKGEFLAQVINAETDSPKLNGNDKIEFLISANVGLPPKSLAKVASGGELSRISLAIQVVTANDKTTPTMIFDEVDTGIGGGTAEIVGQKMRQLSANRQVLCVTHLPQVASQAHTHLFVEKKHDDNSAITSSSVSVLTNKQRINETARMLGGVTITANTLAHAEEMLALTQ
jgi:DNA repair protein RecN (Recombination protein N)